MPDKKVVWILGAGFSVPLGAPLFRELISDKTLKQLRTWKEFAQQTIFMDAPQGDGTARGDRVDVGTLAGIVHATDHDGDAPPPPRPRPWRSPPCLRRPGPAQGLPQGPCDPRERLRARVGTQRRHSRSGSFTRKITPDFSKK